MYTEFGEQGAILRPTSGFHEGSRKLFDLRANKQTLCNLSAALALCELSSSAKWTKYDLSDILYMGDKMFAGITNLMINKDPCMDDFVVEWQHLMESIQIGTNKFTIQEIIKKTGTFYSLSTNTPRGSQIDGDSGAAATSISKLSKKSSELKSPRGSVPAHRTGSKLERLSQNFTKGSSQQNIPLDEKSSTEVPPKLLNLKECLEEWDTVGTDPKSVLESSIFTIALWKQDGLYFVFDPKSCDENAKLTDKRNRDIERTIKKRKAEEARLLKEKEDEQKKLMEEELKDKEVATPDITQKNDSLMTIPEDSVALLSEAGEKIEDISEKEDDETDENNDVEAEDTSCYVAWFLSLADLYEHLIASVPDKHKLEPFTLVQITLNNMEAKKNTEQLMDIHNFKIVTNYWIIRASLSQNDQIFPKTPNRNCQDTTNCITALAMASFCSPEDWTPTILDVILKYGDRLYTKSIQQFNLINPTDKLNLYQIVSPFILANVRITAKVQLNASGDLNALRGNKKILALYDALSELFSESYTRVYGVVMSKQYYLAVWQTDDYYYMFDPHDLGPDGRRRMNGVACLTCFKDIETLTDVILANLDGSVGFNTFQMFNVYIIFFTQLASTYLNSGFLKVELTTTKIPSTCGICTDPDNPDSTYIIPKTKSNSAYHGSKSMKLLNGNMSETCPALKWHMNPPTACHAIAALATSKEINAEYWTPRVVDQVKHNIYIFLLTTLNYLILNIDFDIW